MPPLRPAGPLCHPPRAWGWHTWPTLTECITCAQHRARQRVHLGVGYGSVPPPRGPCRWTLTFFGHKADEAAPHRHLGGLDLTLAGGCPPANTWKVMSPALGARPEHVRVLPGLARSRRWPCMEHLLCGPVAPQAPCPGSPGVQSQDRNPSSRFCMRRVAHLSHF